MKWQRIGSRDAGIGRLLIEALVRVATDEHLETLTAEVLQENYPMHDFLAKYGFDFQGRHDGTMTGRKQLKPVPDGSVLSGKQQIRH